MLAFAGTGNQPPNNPQFSLDQRVRIPSLPAGGGFIDFPIQNGPTINQGDLYLGFQSPTPAAGVMFAADSNGTQQQRGFFSTDNGATFRGPLVLIDQQGRQTPVNIMIRARVSRGPGGNCSFAISPSSQSFSSSGGVGSVSVTAGSSCNWTATSNDNWITITSGSNGSGNGAVNYSVAANTSSNSRTGTLTIAGRPFTVTQSASGSTNTFANPAPITIPSSGPATPYPSSITVSGFAGTVSAVKVTLTNINHAYPDDIDILLVGPSGQSMILMSDVGGGGDLNNVTLTFDDQAASGLPDDSQLTSGTFKPTNFGASDSFPAPAPAGAPTGSALSVFSGINPNGGWSLYVVDDSDGDDGRIAGGWSLTFIPSTPPAACPTISNLTPTSGPVGATVTITGTNFTGVTAVKFSNNVPANPTVNSDTQITATVPNGAVTGPVTISKTGCADVQTATFTVTPPPTTARVVRARNASAAPGGTAKVTIELDSQGDETGMQFSLSYDPYLLSNPQVEPGSDVKNNFSFFEVNDTQAAQGRLGILLLLKDKFAAGSRQVAVVTFTVTSSANETSTQIGFADAPIPRLITDANAGKLAATYLTGTLTFSPGFEADVDGDGLVTVADAQRISLFAAGKPKPDAGSLFQRADCAPRETKGDGLIDLTDVVQAMRYASGKDGNLVPAGGPAGPTTALAASTGAAVKQAASGVASARIVRAVSTGQANALTVELEAQGDEVGLGFSLHYDPHLLRFAGATLGSAASRSMLTVNDDQAASGRVGLLLALPPGQPIASGSQAMVTIHFIALADSPTTARISFGDDPIARQVVDENAHPVAATYSDVTITINNRAVASVSAASFSAGELAGEAIAAAFGTGLAITTQAAAIIPLPTELAGTTVRITDRAGVERFAPLFFVSSSQINYLIPEGTLPGTATVTVTSGDGKVSTGTVQIATVAPGLFAANSNGQGVAAGLALRVRNGVQSYEPIAQWDAAQGRMVPLQLDLGPATDEVYLILYGTGFRYASSPAAVTARIGGTEAQVLYAGPAPGFIGLDQLNLRVPRGLTGCQMRDIVLTVDGQPAKVVQVSIKNGACAKV